jgi:hypothetical protein
MRKWLLLGSLALFSAAHVTHAQTGSTAADCRLARSAYENPFSDSRGWSMRRYQWHAFYAGPRPPRRTELQDDKNPKGASAAIATVGIGWFRTFAVDSSWEYPCTPSTGASTF